MRALALSILVLLFTAPAHAADIATISPTDAASALRTALTQGASKAVSTLGQKDGFFANPEVRIPLPPSVARAEKLLRRYGFGAQADELVLTLNRAAEAAMPEAKTLLVNSVKTMSVEDALSILTGGDDSATQYFRRKTQDALAVKFKPIVAKATSQAGVASSYNTLAGRAAIFGLVDAKDANLDDYVTAQALVGLYKMIAVEELAIRKDPLGQSSRLLRRVFGALSDRNREL